jgi:hypothetical protein
MRGQGGFASSMAKWLFRQHLDNKHNHHMEASKFGGPFIRVGDQGNKTTMP